MAVERGGDLEGGGARKRECNALDIAHATQAASERQRNENTPKIINELFGKTNATGASAGHGARCRGAPGRGARGRQN